MRERLAIGQAASQDAQARGPFECQTAANGVFARVDLFYVSPLYEFFKRRIKGIMQAFNAAYGVDRSWGRPSKAGPNGPNTLDDLDRRHGESHI
ncbi:MAG TPA: hypothetical protein VIO32_10270, partial [Candidatus Baltobacteraceae bacterium]